MNVVIEDGKQRSSKERFKSFALWTIGLFVSLSPLAAPHLVKFATSKADIFTGIFSDNEILFVCVSMLVSASCEIVSQAKKREVLNSILICFIVGFALLYSEFQSVNLVGEAVTRVSYINAIALLITFILGLATYFSRRR